MPNVGPIDGCRIATVARLPMCLKPWPSPTVVVVLPSPSGVGVIAVTTTYFAVGASARSSIASSLIFMTSPPYGSSRRTGRPISAAMSSSGLSDAPRAISRSEGKAMTGLQGQRTGEMGQPSISMPNSPAGVEQGVEEVLAG